MYIFLSKKFAALASVGVVAIGAAGFGAGYMVKDLTTPKAPVTMDGRMSFVRNDGLLTIPFPKGGNAREACLSRTLSRVAVGEWAIPDDQYTSCLMTAPREQYVPGFVTRRAAPE